MNIYDIINIIMVCVILCVVIPMVGILMYACVMRVINDVRAHDAAVCVRTHGDVVRTPEYMARMEELCIMLYNEGYMGDTNTTV